MNDEFLHRLRTEPPPEFAARLKARLDRGARKRAMPWGAIVGVLLFGTAFAFVSPAARHAITALFESSRVSEQVPAALDANERPSATSRTPGFPALKSSGAVRANRPATVPNPFAP
ncbi:MAG TPA: hypothetical protein VGO53_08705, partial [Steroidobacteraceae bacterium]|nr:hypothetical protein [Steroidobacteraceae bacterium]